MGQARRDDVGDGMTDETQSPASETSLHALVEEASRQLTICNACRYCEGFCAVFPALERRTVLSAGDVIQLANLCHDCRACLDACMYSPPHEFAVSPPPVLSATRLASYDRYAWPRSMPRVLRGRVGLFFGAVLCAIVLLVLAVATKGAGALIAAPKGTFSPYDVISYPALVATTLAPFVFALAVSGYAARAYWRDVGGRRLDARSVLGAARSALTMRNQRGGGAGCYYPDDERPSPARRRLHHLVAYGFGLCLGSTVSAGVLQDILGSRPPYPLLSVPVVTGTLGGIGLVVGCLGLLELKRRSSPVAGFADMTIRDYGLLVALAFLGLSGIVVLAVRDTAAFPIAFLVHMAAVVLAFGSWPHSKFVHLVYRFLALIKDEQEKAEIRT